MKVGIKTFSLNLSMIMALIGFMFVINMGSLSLGHTVILYNVMFLFIVYLEKLRTRTIKEMVLSVDNIFIVVYFVYSIMGSIQFLLDQGEQRIWYFTITENTMRETLNLYINIFIILVLGISNTKRININKVSSAVKEKIVKLEEISNIYLIDVIAILCFGILGLSVVINFNILLSSGYVEFRRAVTFHGLQYLWLYMIAYSINFMSIYFYNQHGTLKGYNFIRLFIIICFWLESMLIDRRHLIPVLISCMIMFIDTKHRISLKKAIVSITTIFLLMVYAVVRLGYSFSDLPFNTLIYTMFGEFIITNYITCYFIANPVTNLFYGVTYLVYPFMKLIPRVIYEEKYIDLSVQFYNNVIQSGSAFAFNPVAEGLLNFGMYAVFFVPLILCAILCLGKKLYYRVPLFYYFMCGYSLDYLRGEFANCMFDMFVIFIFLYLMKFNSLSMRSMKSN